MERSELEIIKDLMEELQGAMEYGEDDFAERLGKKKPGMEIVKIEGEMSPELEAKEEMLGEDLDGDMEMGEDPEHAAMVMDPDEKLKKRLLKIRG